MSVAISSLGLALVLSAAALAAPTTFSPDPNHTFVRFAYNHQGFSTQQSRFNTITGTVVFDAAAKTAQIDILIDTKSVDTGSELFNGHIQAADLLDTADFPTPTFKSTAVKFDGDTPSSIDGILTIKGVSKPVTLKVTAFKHALNAQKKDQIGADATGTIKRSDYKMDKFVPVVGDEVTLTIAIEARAS
jgi:polyisoprenoid-binding protein YceI